MSEHCGFVVQVKDLRPHSNADCLQILRVFEEDVIVGLDTHIGDIGVYFPCDLQLSEKFCEINNLVRKKDEKNKTDYLDNMICNYKHKNVNNNKNKDNKYILANKYYSDILLRILKYHVKEDINIKNILFQLLDLNHKKIGLMSDIENLLSNKMKDTNKKRNEINKKKKELENVENTINYFDKELKKYEPK